MYSYVIEVADSESDCGLHENNLISEIFAFYHFLENALRRTGCRGHEHGTGRETPPTLFDLKIVYSYVIEVADSESDLGLHDRALVSEIFAFYHLLEYARGRPGRRGHVHIGHNFSIKNFFQNFLTFFTFIRFMRVLRVYVVYLLLRVYVGYLLVRVYVGYLLVFTFEGVYLYLLLRVYVGYLL